MAHTEKIKGTVVPASPAGDFLFSYEYGIAVNEGTHEAPKWRELRFLSSVDPKRETKTQDAPTYDDKGADSSVVVGETWTLEFYIQGHRTTDGHYQAELETILNAVQPDSTGEKASLEFIWFDKPANGQPNPDDAFFGLGSVSATRAETGNDGIGGFNVTVTGRGPRTAIKNPYDKATGKIKVDGI